MVEQHKTSKEDRTLRVGAPYVTVTSVECLSEWNNFWVHNRCDYKRNVTRLGPLGDHQVKPDSPRRGHYGRPRFERSDLEP